jgi:uncharacterized protein YifN (PemK superfamily)
MTISYSPKVGEILECDFGEYRTPRLTPPYDGLLPSEIRKRRLAVVLNGKLPNNCCLVVPISSTHAPNSVTRGYHVLIDPKHITRTSFYDQRDRWAITDCLEHVSKERLFQVQERGAPITDILPRELVEAIQRAAIRTINAGSLLAAPKG